MYREMVLEGAKTQLARETLKGCLTLAQASGMKFHAASAHRLLGEVFTSERRYHEATAHFEQSIEMLRQIRSEDEVGRAYAGYAHLLKQLGRTGETRDYLSRALEIFERLGTLIEPDKVRAELAELRER